MPTRIVLQIDGGGIRGITPALVLKELEKQIRQKRSDLRVKMRDLLSLCCGTSTGAVMAGMVCAGVEAAEIARLYAVDGVNLFGASKTPWYKPSLLFPKYDRTAFVAKFEEILQNSSATGNANVTLGELPPNVIFMATAYNLCSFRTHFVKSDEAKDKCFQLKDVITWSGLSAAHYFGKVDAPSYVWKYTNANAPPGEEPKPGAVFQDGGQATENCTLGFVLTEILARGWDMDKEKVIIISLGTGNKTPFEAYDDAKNTSEVRQTAKYLAGQARKEATPVQIMAARYVAKVNPNIKVFRLDYETDKDYELDDVENVAVYKQGADTILGSHEFQNLLQALAEHGIGPGH